MAAKDLLRISPILEALYDRYNHREFIGLDPLSWIYRFEDPADREVVGLFAALLAYGRVQQINKSLDKLFTIMDMRPADFLRNFNKSARKKLDPFKHRFNTGQDIADFCEILKVVLKKNGSIERFFLEGYDHAQPDVATALESFSSRIMQLHSARQSGPLRQSFKYLVPNVADGSPCKRLNLFLRWMVRHDQVDPGLWQNVDPSKLIVPVDIHMWRLTKILGLHKRNTTSIAAAREITAGFAKISPHDPVKYDFSLSRIGIIENCTGKPNAHCKACELMEYCAAIHGR